MRESKPAVYLVLSGFRARLISKVLSVRRAMPSPKDRIGRELGQDTIGLVDPLSAGDRHRFVVRLNVSLGPVLAPA